jgi:hypothetical protein
MRSTTECCARYNAESRNPQDIPKFHILKWSQSVMKGELQTTADQLTIRFVVIIVTTGVAMEVDQFSWNWSLQVHH